nr:YdcF family protein [Periweissella fabalis]
MTAFIVYRVVKPSLDKDYILILGAGLSDGIFVSPILQHRVQKGLDFAQTQFNQTGKYPYVIMSGGQGTDETLPEAVAMANYARKVGFPPEYILLETASRNTFENMQFSKQILQAHGLDIKKGIFVTSGYHVFRASVYAHDNGLKINGIGSKTRHHFWYDALIREYLAILARYYRLHLLVLLILVLLSLVSMFVKL